MAGEKLIKKRKKKLGQRLRKDRNVDKLEGAPRAVTLMVSAAALPVD
jgi:hypothetical protein